MFAFVPCCFLSLFGNAIHAIMEVDDVEQNLLQQFSCMGTTDRDVLISQLRKLVGEDVNETTASFFLDMNNW